MIRQQMHVNFIEKMPNHSLFYHITLQEGLGEGVLSFQLPARPAMRG